MSAEEAYPRIPECPRPSGWSFERDDWFDDRTNERKLSAKKRLTDAELAAIYWGFVQTDMLWPDARTDPGETDPDYWDAACKRWREAEETVHRFAALPHYDEPSPDLLNSTRPTKAEE